MNLERETFILGKIAEAPNADPEVIRRLYTRPMTYSLKWAHDWRVLFEQPSLIVIQEVLHNGHRTVQYLPYYMSMKGRFIFQERAGEHQGMKEATFGQFTFFKETSVVHAYAEMMTTEDHSKVDFAHFKKCIERLRARQLRKANDETR